MPAFLKYSKHNFNSALDILSALQIEQLEKESLVSKSSKSLRRKKGFAYEVAPTRIALLLSNCKHIVSKDLLAGLEPRNLLGEKVLETAQEQQLRGFHKCASSELVLRMRNKQSVDLIDGNDSGMLA